MLEIEPIGARFLFNLGGESLNATESSAALFDLRDTIRLRASSSTHHSSARSVGPTSHRPVARLGAEAEPQPHRRKRMSGRFPGADRSIGSGESEVESESVTFFGATTRCRGPAVSDRECRPGLLSAGLLRRAPLRLKLKSADARSDSGCGWSVSSAWRMPSAGGDRRSAAVQHRCVRRRT